MGHFLDCRSQDNQLSAQLRSSPHIGGRLPTQFRGTRSLRLQVCKSFLLWALKYVNRTYFGLFKDPGFHTTVSRNIRLSRSGFEGLDISGMPEIN